MTSSLERRLDGSLALLIDGDLQVDRIDQASYSAAIFPALAISAQRNKPESLISMAAADHSLADYLRNLATTRAMLLVDREEAVSCQVLIQEELEAFQEAKSAQVQYANQVVPRAEAIISAQHALWKAGLKVQTIDAQIARIPVIAGTAYSTDCGGDTIYGTESSTAFNTTRES